MLKVFNLEIYTPDRTFFSGDAQGLIVTTASGEMEVMCNTLPFVTNLISGVIKIKNGGKWINAVCSEGFINVSKNDTTVLAESCYWPNEVNHLETAKEIEELDMKAKKAQSLREYKMAKAQLAIQFAKLKIKKGGDI